MALSDDSRAPAVSVASRSEGCWWLGWAVIVVGFALVRLTGLFNNLWLDEVWSLRMVQSIHSPWEILTKLQHDNNHPLNSLYLYVVQPAGADWVYRLFSWLAGSATVGLGALIGRQQYRRWHGNESTFQVDLAGWLTGILFGGAYLLIHYSSEARGYAPAVAFGLVAFYALIRSAGNNAVRWMVLYSAAAVLGLLAHLAMGQVMIAAGCWSLGRFCAAQESLRSRMIRFTGMQAPSWLFFAVYYFGFVRQMQIGGGPENPLLDVLGETAAYLTGMPTPFGMLALVLVMAGILIGLGLMWRQDRSLAVCYTLVILVTPVLGMILSKFTLLFPRYFLMSAAFALPVVGYALARLMAVIRGGRWLVLGLMVLFLTGNGWHVVRLIHEGRGHYREALRVLAERTPFNDVTISSDHDFRNYALVDYYHGTAAPGKKVSYYSVDRLPPIGTQWRILHRIDGNAETPKHISDELGNFYVKDRVYPCEGLSGWTWIVYRNMQLEPKD